MSAFQEALTEKQRNVLQFICVHSATKGYPPTLAEMAKHFGFTSTNTVRCYLKSLQLKGAIEVDPGVYRGIRVIHV